MSPNGRRAWRRAAKKLRRKMGRRWRSQEEWLFGTRWSEIVPNLEAHRRHITGAWFKRHGFTEQGQTIDPVRVYIGLWGTADGDGVEYAVPSTPCTPRSIVGRTNGARKRKPQAFYQSKLRLRPCPGCPECNHGKRWRCDNCGATKRQCDLILAEVRCKCGKGCGQWRISFPATTVCDGGGVLLAKRQFCLGCSWCGTPPKEGATRFTECDGSGVLPARRPLTPSP